ESLLAAARILREMPRPAKLDAKVEVSKEGEKDPKPGAEVPQGEAVDLTAETTAILGRARKILASVDDAKKKAAYDTLIENVGKRGDNRAVKGGPKAISRTLKGGETHDYYWEWEEHMPGTVAFQATAPIYVHVMSLQSKLVNAVTISASGSA